MLHALPLLLSLLAQAPPNASASPQSKERAQALLKEGSALYKQAAFAGALQKFEAAYALYPSPKLQFNIAQADRELGRLVGAVEAFETFLMQAPDAAPELAAEARRSIGELKPKLAQIRIDAAPGAQISVDERAIGFTPLTRIVWAVPGRHQVAVRHPSYEAAPVEVNVSAGEISTVTPRLVGASVAAAAPPPSENLVVATPVPAAPEKPAAAHRSWVFWTTAAATVLFTGGAVAAGLAANAKQSELQNGCGATTERCSESQIDELKLRAHLATAFWILAGASAAATGVTFYVDSREAAVSVALRF